MELADLERALRSADPAAFLIKPRFLRRVIKHDRRPPGVGLQVPHRKSHVIARDRALEIVEPADLGALDASYLPPTLHLIARPYPFKLAALAPELAWIKYWRLLFHCQVHDALSQRFVELKKNPAEIARRIHKLGSTEFDEAQRVLRQEKYVLPPADDWALYEEFGAVYLELRYFSSFLLPHYFPAITDFDRIDALLAEDLDAKAIFCRTRLVGAPENPILASVSTALQAARDTEADDPGPSTRAITPDRCALMMKKAERAAADGNLVRAAIYREQASPAPAEPKGAELPKAGSEMEALIARLQAALSLGPHDLDEWRQALPPLLKHAASGVWPVEARLLGVWPVEARLLYDLQRACIDYERGIYAVDVVEWAVTLGRRPIKRPLPRLREAHLVKHLRKATARLAKVRLSDMDRQRLSAVLHSAVHQSEARLRDRFRPLIEGVLDNAGLKPANFPERIALNKLVEELLDRVADRGFLNIGDLRDAISRNGLKLPDLRGVRKFIHGDELLRTDREMAVALDGVYRRGEIYMRWLQSFSSLAFGTAVGRFLTLFFIVPFGGAFVVLKAAQKVIHLYLWLFIHGEEHAPETELDRHIMSPFALVGLAFLIFSLFHVPLFRKVVVQVLRYLWLFARGIFYDLPVAIMRLTQLWRILESPPLVFFYRFLLTPTALAGLTWACLASSGYNTVTSLAGSVAAFVVAMLGVSSRIGRDLEELTLDWLMRGMDRIRFGILPGLFHFIMGLFKGMIEFVERFLYSVDEWLRFKSGESRLTLVVKATLGAVWFFLTYIIRIYVNLLIEPTVNPIKHFPVVTVGHKIMAPASLFVYYFLEDLFLPLGKVTAIALAGTTVFFIPGIFGFIVWELKENWRLYRANRPPTLRPTLIGHHGETMIRLMRPGIHSGTLPKLFARLRKAERGGHRTGNWRSVQKYLGALHHVEEAIRHFAERELIQVLRESRGWQPLRTHLGRIALGSNRVRVELASPDLSVDSLWLSFEDRSGWLLAGIDRPGWLGDLTQGQAQVLETALAGFYKLAGAQLVRQQIESCFGALDVAYDIRKEGLVVWREPDFARKAVYDLGAKHAIVPKAIPESTKEEFPTLAPGQVMFSAVPVFWGSWLESWERDQAGDPSLKSVAGGVRLLPVSTSGRRGQ